MRKQLCVGALALSFIVSMLAAATASAMSVDGMRTQIPFDFQVGDVLLPAGQYTITSLTSDEMTIRISDGRKNVACVITMSKEDSLRSEPRPRLVFHKYGDQYFLVAAWGNDRTGRELPESKRERRLRHELVAAHNAAAAMEIVTVIAQ